MASTNHLIFRTSREQQQRVERIARAAGVTKTALLNAVLEAADLEKMFLAKSTGAKLSQGRRTGADSTPS